MTVMKFQIGKQGITPGVMESLVLAFKNHKQVRISVLKSSGRTRENIKEMAEDIIKQLAPHSRKGFAFRVIGFTIIIVKL